MRVSIASQPGGTNPNEDWVACTPAYAVLLDGLSTSGLDGGCRHGVPWYVANLGGQLIATLATSPKSICDGLFIALEKVAGLHQECDLKNPGTPSATVSIVREQDDRFEYAILADSPIVFEEKGGFTAVTDLRVDDAVPELIAETERYETGSADHAASLARLIAAQRLIRNTSEGYWVAASMPEAADHAIVGYKDRGDVESIALLSDGVSRLVTDYGAATWSEAFQMLREKGPIALIKTVRNVEATDPLGRRWPRYKTSDDATVAYCET